MGCRISQLQEENQLVMTSSSQMKYNVNLENPIQEPKNSLQMKIFPNQATPLYANQPSIELQGSDPFIIPSTSLKSTQNQQQTLQNILTVMNGQRDSVIEFKKEIKSPRRRQKTQRISIEQLEKLF